jgi:hypothetical protein
MLPYSRIQYGLYSTDPLFFVSRIQYGLYGSLFVCLCLKKEYDECYLIWSVVYVTSLLPSRFLVNIKVHVMPSPLWLCRVPHALIYFFICLQRRLFFLPNPIQSNPHSIPCEIMISRRSSINTRYTANVISACISFLLKYQVLYCTGIMVVQSTLACLLDISCMIL